MTTLKANLKATRAGDDGLKPVNAEAVQSAIDGVDFGELVAAMPEDMRERITSRFDMVALARVFEDESLMHTVDVFIENGLNVSLTSRKLYMHRNTLQYRLNSIYKITGINLKSVRVAVVFKMLHYLYLSK